MAAPEQKDSSKNTTESHEQQASSNSEAAAHELQYCSSGA
jgi:hypothetical protein